MSSSYTTSLKIQEIGNGEQSGIWGSTTNTNWQLIEQAVAGVQTITMANNNYTLSNLNGLSDEARNMVLVVTGTNNTTYQVIAPLVPKMYVVTNNTSGGNAITIGASTGSIITIPNGTTAQVYCDGSTGFYSAQTGSAGNFTVNGNLTVTGNQADVGSFSAASISVSGAATFATSPTAPTPSNGDNSTKVATTAYVYNAIGGSTLGTMAQQNATAVAITGGSVDATVIGSSSAASITGTTITSTTQFTGPGTGLTGTAASLTVGSASTATTATTATTANNGAKAWVNYNGVSQTINASYNVSSVTYNAAGSYTVNFTSALTNGNLVCFVTSSTGLAVGQQSGGFVWGVPTSTSVNVGVTNGNANLQDNPYVFVAVFR